ncbi:hypothetical protein [Erythrobacter donghaensis]|uniref:hypothetical protein n=1 Tax=Erythrobacter donghaensis TaxID=267135 RepID=UPI00117EC391|nr:hypothetical protein [Erythrobacter donghaensis]
MANSSDWLVALAEPEIAETAAPDWLASLGAPGAFREAALFGETLGKPAPPDPAPVPEPASDPLAVACARAFAEGEAAGRAAAEAESAALAARQRALRLTFRALDEAALGVLADDLAATVLHLCDSVLGEAARDADALRARCITAARRIGGAPDTLALHLHPDDMALLGEEVLAAMRCVPDPALEPGSLVIEGPDGSVSDGPAAWRRAIAAALRG